MLAKELLLVLGFVITGAVSLPITQGTTDSAPTLLDRDLSNDIHAAVLQARVPGGKKGKPVPPNKWANPMLPQVVEKKPAPPIPDMDKLWSGRSSKPAPKPGTTKPPKVPVKPKDKKSRDKRDVEEGVETYQLEARGGKKGKPVPPNKWANPMLPQIVEKKPAPPIPDMDKLWSGRSSKPAPKPGTTKPPKVPVKPKDKKSRDKRDVDDEAEEAAEYDQ